MTFLVSVGFSTGASIPARYLRLDDPVAGRLDVGLLAPAGLTTDLSVDSNGQQRVMEFAIDRGSTQGAGALVEYSTGTLSLTLRDDQGDLDPANIAEPIPGVSMRLSKVWNGTVWPLFSGTIDSWLPSLIGPDQAVVQITASDALATIGGYVRGDDAPAGAGDISGSRIGRILDAVGWPTGQRDIDAGTATLAATTLGGNALDQLRATARAEIGDLWANPAGIITFRDRLGLYNTSTSTTVQATLGSDRAAGELPYVSLGMSYDRSTVVNVVRAGRDGGIVYEAGDDVSRSRYGDKALEQTDLPLADDTQVVAWADYVRARGSVPRLRFTQVVLDVLADEEAFYPQVLGRDLGHRVAVVRRPPGVTADSRQVYIRGIRHSFQAPRQWQTTWELGQAFTSTPFILDDPARGALDSGNVLAF